MGRIIDVIIHCGRTNNRYKTYFEEKAPGNWYGIRTERIEPLSFFERIALKSRAKKSSQASFTKVSVGTAINKSTGQANVYGEFFLGNHYCPYCNNGNYVRCGACQEWTCHAEGASQFTCAICGNSGTVRGTIKSATGNLSQGGGKKF